MRFSIFKSFSLHIHRRSKSESSAADPVAPTLNTRTRSLSVPNVDELALDLPSNVVSNTPTAYPISISTPTPTPASTPATNVQAPSPTPVPVTAISSATSPRVDVVSSLLPITQPAQRLAAVRQRILTLEAEVADLKDAKAVLILDAEIRQEELTVFKSDYYAERSKANTRRRQAKDDEEKRNALERKVVQLERFIGFMIDLGLHEPVLARARRALQAGEDADEALVDSIKEAAAKPGSPWSKIIPAVTGPRSSDEYLSAINMTLKTRRDLKESQKIAKFWKTTAQEDGAHANTITPSSSNLSSIHEVLTEERQTAVDDLLEKLRNGDRPVRRRTAVPKLREAVPTPSEAIIPSTEQTRISLTPEIIPSPSESTSTIRDSTCTIRPYVPTLAPLASQTFKEELVASHSSERFSVTKQLRPILGNVDMNRQHNIALPIPSSDSLSSHRSKPSAKALGKRRAMVVTESIESISASFRSIPLHVPALPTHTELVLPTEDSFTKMLSASLGTLGEHLSNEDREENVAPHWITDGIAPFNNSPFVDHVTNSGTKPSVSGPVIEFAPSQAAVNAGSLSPDNALLSLERICAGFDSGSSLGSLGTISEVSEGDSSQDDTLKDISIVPDSVVASSFSEEGSTILPDDIQDTSVSLVAESPAKHSRLPVFKRLRQLSISISPKKKPNVSPSRSILKPTVSSALKTSMAISHAKKYSNENSKTPPLLLKKRTGDDICSPTTTPSATKSRMSRIPSRKPATTTGSGMVNKGKRAARTLSRIIS